MAALELQVAKVTNLQPESIRNPIAAGACVVLTFQYFLRDGDLIILQWLQFQGICQDVVKTERPGTFDS